MPPNQDDRPQEVSTSESEIFSFPQVPSPIDLTSLSTTVSEFSIDPPISPHPLYETIEIPREPTLKDLVQNSTGLEDISEVTTVKLQVITVDVSLQYLSYYTPLLRELILDGSVVSSLRDLGCGLKNLKVLQVNRCGLKYLDGTFGFDCLEELYATKNKIKDISTCSNLPKIKVIDVRNNCLADVDALTFLSLCPKLEHISLEENEDITNCPMYRRTIKCLIPNLKTLDGQPFSQEECLPIGNNVREEETNQKESEQKEISSKKESTFPPVSSRKSSLAPETTYVVTFPPKALSPRQSTSSDSSRDIQVNKMFPQINQSRNPVRRTSTSNSDNQNTNK